MKKVIIFSFIFGITIYCFSNDNANAEFYEYKDSSGVIHYTDNYSTIPEEYQNQIEIKDEIKSDSVLEPPAKKMDEKKRQTVKGLIESSPSKVSVGRFQKRKNDLDKEYQIIMKDQESLAEFKKKLKTDADYKEYNKKIAEIKNKIKSYSEKRDAFKKDLDNYNRQRALETLKKLEEAPK